MSVPALSCVAARCTNLANLPGISYGAKFWPDLCSSVSVGNVCEATCRNRPNRSIFSMCLGNDTWSDIVGNCFDGKLCYVVLCCVMLCCAPMVLETALRVSHAVNQSLAICKLC